MWRENILDRLFVVLSSIVDRVVRVNHSATKYQRKSRSFYHSGLMLLHCHFWRQQFRRYSTTYYSFFGIVWMNALWCTVICRRRVSNCCRPIGTCKYARQNNPTVNLFRHATYENAHISIDTKFKNLNCRMLRCWERLCFVSMHFITSAAATAPQVDSNMETRKLQTLERNEWQKTLLYIYRNFQLSFFLVNRFSFLSNFRNEFFRQLNQYECDEGNRVSWTTQSMDEDWWNEKTNSLLSCCNKLRKQRIFNFICTFSCVPMTCFM